VTRSVSTNPCTKLLIVGLDGGSFAYLDPLMEQGVMPNLSRLGGAGCRGTLLSTLPPFTVPAWTSFQTGKNPGKHGVVSFFKQDASAYRCQSKGQLVDSRDIPGETLWDMLGAAGLSVGMVNVPMTYPPRPVRGYCVAGMLTPPGAQDFTYPSGLRDRLDGYQIDLEELRTGDRLSGEASLNQRQYLAKVYDMTRRRAETCLRLLHDDPPDVFMTVFTGTDRLAHEFWPTITAGCPLDDPLGPPLRAYFSDLDAFIGQLISAAGKEVQVIVMSDHGFGPAPRRRFAPNRWLLARGLLRTKDETASRGLRSRLGTVAPRLRRVRAALRRLLPDRWLDQARRAIYEDIAAGVDWDRTQAFFTPLYGSVGGISLNVAGQRPHGIVQAGEASDALSEEIVSALGEVVDPSTGKCIVQRVGRREDLYHGPKLDNFPEVVFVLDPAYNAHGTLLGDDVVGATPYRPRKGEHRPEGILLMRGPKMRRGKQLAPARIEDVLPTILYALGLEIPDDVDGRVLTEAYDQAFRVAQPIQTRPPRDVTPLREETVLDATAEGAVVDRLRALGYLGD
jgi:predicted AlkP superfamily phosphohydrolase/phosphomutase